jgi:hypothetical protein
VVSIGEQFNDGKVILLDTDDDSTRSSHQKIAQAIISKNIGVSLMHEADSRPYEGGDEWLMACIMMNPPSH